MFVPKAGGRNTRRRQRTSSDDSVKPPKAKRQRSVLRRPDESPSDTNLGRELTKLATPTAPSDDITPTDLMNELHISARGAKQGDGSGNNNEGTIVLVGLSYLCAFLQTLKSKVLTCRVQSQAQIFTLLINCHLCQTKFVAYNQVSQIL